MKTFILLSALILVFIFSTAIGQVSITLHPDQDAVIGFHDNYNSANTNYGNADYYGAFSQPGASGGENAAHSLMDFDLSDIPAGSTINSATLTLYGRGATNNSGDATSVGNIGDNPCYLERIISAWQWNVVTWNTQPSTTSQSSVTLPQSSNIIQDYTDIDVSGLVADMINDPSNSYGFSIRLVTEDPTRGLFFCSTDYSDESKHPTLKITYTPCSTPTVFTFHVVQDAVVGFHDNYDSENTNYGTADYYGAFSQPGASGGENAAHSLMQFDLSSLPPGMLISSATLDLYGRGATNNAGDATSVGDIGDDECYLERITQSWDADVVTWNTKPSVTSVNSVMLPQSSNVIQDYPGINVTQLVQDMIDNPLSSFGFSMRLVTEDPTRGLFFCSTDYIDSAKFPVLTVSTCSKLSGIISTSPDQSSLRINPNPAFDLTTITIPENLRGKQLNIFVSDILGNNILALKVKSGEEVSLNVSGIPTGVYNLRLDDGVSKRGSVLVISR
ncbi:MAG: DNRLRE domain-containing protein [Bacteroidetes bacterium]|nr:DNRLRE domain-containing protein [Bacteroidota bacterium]